MDKYMIVDNRYIKEAQKAWGRQYNIIPSVSCDALSEPVCAHPDMVLFKTGEREFICAPEVFREYELLLKKYGVKLICGEKKLNCHYPEDIAYNVFKTDKFALAKFSETDIKIKEFLDKKKIKKINVKQGYTKCSVCDFFGGVISADVEICKVMELEGESVLKIEAGEIILPGYDYGFIGGASGVNSDGDIFFFGDLSYVSYGGKILDFLNSKGLRIFEIKNLPLTDVGTIMFF